MNAKLFVRRRGSNFCLPACDMRQHAYQVARVIEARVGAASPNRQLIMGCEVAVPRWLPT